MHMITLPPNCTHKLFDDDDFFASHVTDEAAPASYQSSAAGPLLTALPATPNIGMAALPSQVAGPSAITKIARVITENGQLDEPAGIRDTIRPISLSQPRSRTRKTESATVLTSSPFKRQLGGRQG